MKLKKMEGVIAHFVKAFNEKTFDEYDVMGFILTIRNDKLKEEQPFLYDFANIVAHRTRTEGIAFNAMKKAIDNGFKLNSKGKVLYYNGPSYNCLTKEIKEMAAKYRIDADKRFIKEFILCLIVIAQHTVCEDEKHNNICTLEIFRTKDEKLALVTVGNNASVCYLLCDSKIILSKHYEAGHITEAIEVLRVGGCLEIHVCESGELA